MLIFGSTDKEQISRCCYGSPVIFCSGLWDSSGGQFCKFSQRYLPQDFTLIQIYRRKCSPWWFHSGISERIQKSVVTRMNIRHNSGVFIRIDGMRISAFRLSQHVTDHGFHAVLTKMFPGGHKIFSFFHNFSYLPEGVFFT